MTLIKKNIFLFCALIIFFEIKSQENLIQSPIADMLDSLSSQKVFDIAFNKPVFPKNNIYKYSKDSVPYYDEFTLQSRLAKLNDLTPFDLVYNEHVRGFINLYIDRKRESLSRMIGVSQLYYPMFEEVLDKYNIPLELKHLAVIESALNPNAKSRCGATGLWQFMYPTGKTYGLNVTSYIDERCNPYKATVAAAIFLKSLYSMFGDWQMVLAAYNAGPGTISKAIRRSGGKKTYWEIRPFLPKETQGYVPAFIAANYAMNYSAEHNIYGALPRKTYFEVDTVVVKEQMSFDQISQALNISIEEIMYFNPQYRKNIIPAGGNMMCLPKNKIGVFLNNEQLIYSTIYNQEQKVASEGSLEVKKIHTVSYGEKLSTIALLYQVTIKDIKTWNYIGKKGVYPGRKIIIFVKTQNLVNDSIQKKIVIEPSIEDPANNKLLVNNEIKKENIFIYHKVKKGESIFTISKKFKTSVSNLSKLNGLKTKKLVTGKILKIKLK